MKKTVTLTLASTLLLGLLAGCGTNQGSQSAGAADTSLADASNQSVQTADSGNFSDEMKIPHAVDLSPEDGADSVERQGDHADSIYFAHPDFYNMESTDTLTILTNFRTIQQSSEWSCGVTSALMVLDWYGKLGRLERGVPGGAAPLAGRHRAGGLPRHHPGAGPGYL